MAAIYNVDASNSTAMTVWAAACGQEGESVRLSPSVPWIRIDTPTVTAHNVANITDIATSDLTPITITGQLSSLSDTSTAPVGYIQSSFGPDSELGYQAVGEVDVGISNYSITNDIGSAVFSVDLGTTAIDSDDPSPERQVTIKNTGMTDLSINTDDVINMTGSYSSCVSNCDFINTSEIRLPPQGSATVTLSIDGEVDYGYAATSYTSLIRVQSRFHTEGYPYAQIYSNFSGHVDPGGVITVNPINWILQEPQCYDSSGHPIGARSGIIPTVDGGLHPTAITNKQALDLQAVVYCPDTGLAPPNANDWSYNFFPDPGYQGYFGLFSPFYTFDQGSISPPQGDYSYSPLVNTVGVGSGNGKNSTGELLPRLSYQYIGSQQAYIPAAAEIRISVYQE